MRAWAACIVVAVLWVATSTEAWQSGDSGGCSICDVVVTYEDFQDQMSYVVNSYNCDGQRLHLKVYRAGSQYEASIGCGGCVSPGPTRAQLDALRFAGALSGVDLPWSMGSYGYDWSTVECRYPGGIAVYDGLGARIYESSVVGFASWPTSLSGPVVVARFAVSSASSSQCPGTYTCVRDGSGYVVLIQSSCYDPDGPGGVEGCETVTACGSSNSLCNGQPQVCSCCLFGICDGAGGGPCSSYGGDADGDGCCLSSDCNDQNPNLCVDCGGPCAMAGGDGDDDGCCATYDCDDADATRCESCTPCAIGHVDVDGDGCCTNTDCDDTDSSVCQDCDGDGPCEEDGGDGDEDGCCADFDCDDGDPEFCLQCPGVCDALGGDGDEDGCCDDNDVDASDPEVCNPECWNATMRVVEDADEDGCCTQNDANDDDPDVCRGPCWTEDGSDNDRDGDGCCGRYDDDDDDPGVGCECECEGRLGEMWDAVNDLLADYVIAREGEQCDLVSEVSIPLPMRDPVLITIDPYLSSGVNGFDIGPIRNVMRAFFLVLAVYQFMFHLYKLLREW